MTDLKQTLGKTTEQLEKYLEPWQRGLLIIFLLTLLIFATYHLTKPEQQTNKRASQKEKEIEERILRQMAFFKRLRE